MTTGSFAASTLNGGAANAVERPDSGQHRKGKAPYRERHPMGERRWTREVFRGRRAR